MRGRACSQQQVFLDREVGKDAHVLGHIGDVELGNRRRGQARDVLLAKADAALAGLPQAHDGAQRGGLARAIAAQQHGDLAARHSQVHAVQDVIGADMGVHALELQQ
jgi:hypothetical protein